LSTFALFPKVQKEIIVIIGGPGTGKVLYYRWINRQRLLLLQKFQSNLRGKKQGIEQLFLEKPLFSELLLEGKNNSLMHRMNRMKLFY
jgi:hypothetical protein